MTTGRDRLADRRARSVALRGWDRAAINDVLQHGREPGLFDVNRLFLDKDSCLRSASLAVEHFPPTVYRTIRKEQP